MSENRTIRAPHFLDEQAPQASASPVTFTRLSSPRAGGAGAAPLRAGPTPVRPPPTPPRQQHAEHPPEVAAAAGAVPAPLETVTPVPSSPSQAALLAGMLGPAPSVPGPWAAESARRLDAAVQRLKLESGRLADQARADALEIGFQVARRILEQELSSGPEPLFALVRSAVRRLGDARRLVIKLHPADAERIDTTDGRQKLGLSLMQVEVAADPSLTPGDCVIESDQATVDGRLATRLDEVKRSVESALAEEG